MEYFYYFCLSLIIKSVTILKRVLLLRTANSN